ncbi:restriction endonuclease subunit S [Microcystis aeruginosa]|uniref:restriction endonuclease subunit S n=1 Tax=Microcystis aeruginosa TaxID=1126 RepID=UPI0023311258|nr:restriction endonuclease subunit S [Microcystis aeruginosa]MDB9418195.1 restriction endonuclease subunit S [Microcystis aeruginosa CS-556/03]
MMRWEVKKLGEVCTLQRGFDLPKNLREKGDYPLISSSGEIDTHCEPKVKSPGIVTGRSGSIGSLFFVEKDFWPLNTTLFVKDFHGNDPRFIFYLLKHFDLGRFASGTGVPTLNRNHVHDEKINITTSLEEQKRIVEILDKAFEGIAQAEANTRRNLINARELFNSYLNNIFIQKKGDWETKTIADISTKIEYGSSSKSAQYENNDSIPVLRMGNIQNGLINWNDLVYTDRKDEIEKYSLQYNDVLFNRTNSDIHVGKSGIYKGERPAIFAGYLIRIHYKKEEINPDFLNFYLNSSIAREYGSSVMSRSINQANINGTKLKSYPIYIPSLPMQNKIVDSLYKLKNQAKKLETIYQRKLEAIAELKQSILEKAFTGQLSQ